MNVSLEPPASAMAAAAGHVILKCASVADRAPELFGENVIVTR